MGKWINRQSVVTILGALLVYAIVQISIVMGILPQFVGLTLIQVCIFIILATSLNLISGVTGQLF